MPALFAYERYAHTPARVGRIVDIIHRNDGYGLTFAIGPTVPPILPEQFETPLRPLDIDPKWEMNRTHWAVKHVDLGNVLHQANVVSTPTLVPQPRPPRVFISYSWDSPEHKLWVAKLARDLYGFGVEVILDQWHAEPGQDLAAFMETNVQNCDRVLVVCTELYVQKAQARQGGVAYEQLLVTSLAAKSSGYRIEYGSRKKAGTALSIVSLARWWMMENQKVTLSRRQIDVALAWLRVMALGVKI